MTRKGSLVLVFGLFAGILLVQIVFRNFISDHDPWQDIFFKFLCFPILLGAFWWGLRGGLFFGFLAAAASFFDLFYNSQIIERIFYYNKLTEMILFLGLGGLLGGLVEAERRVKWERPWARNPAHNFFRRTVLDPLTHCYNRNFMKKILKTHWNNARKGGDSFSLLMIGLNHFKEIHDKRGQTAGEMVLKSTVQTIFNQTRKSDFVFRYGGEEFLILLPGCPSQVALSLARRLRQEMAKVTFRDQASGFKADFSVGVLEYHSRFIDIPEMLAKLDQTLYRAKQDKTCVALAS